MDQESCESQPKVASLWKLWSGAAVSVQLAMQQQSQQAATAMLYAALYGRGLGRV